jgi:hypothetical protein
MKESKLTTRLLEPTFWLDDLSAELKVVAARNNAAQARREIEDFIKKTLKQGAMATWPSDPLGRAAFLLWLLRNPNGLPPFIHQRDRHKLSPANWGLKSVLLDRNIRRPE